MRISFEKPEFLEALQRAQSVVTSKTTLSVLANVLVECADSHVIITCTDLQVGIRCKTPVKVIEPGATTMPARLLLSILREIPGDTVDISVDSKDIATITAGRSFFRLHGIQKSEYPKLPEFEDSEAFSLQQDALAGLLRKTIYSISREDSRYALMGLYFLLKNKELTLVSTDGRRLSKMSIPVDVDIKFKKDFIVPLKAVEELQRMLGKEGDLKVFLSRNQVGFDLEHTRLSCRLIDGAFPDYERVIPQSSQEKIRLSRQEFLSVVRIASLMANEPMSMLRLKFEKEKLTASSQLAEVGEAMADMPINYSGEAIEIGFNPGFVRDVLLNLDDEEIDFELTDSQCPGVVRGSGGFIHVLMPMRLLDSE